MLHLTLALAANAEPCDDALDQLAAGAPPSAVAAIARTATWDAAAVDCLVEHGAPARVVSAALRSSDFFPPRDERVQAFELAAGGSWIPGREIATPGTVDLRFTWLPRPQLGLELAGSVGVQGDRPVYQAITKQLIDPPLGDLQDELTYLGAATVQFAPFAGEVTGGGRPIGFRLYGLTGSAAVQTVDDVVGSVLQRADDPAFHGTRVQIHPALIYGGGLRIAAYERLGVRLQVDNLQWVETYEGTTLAMSHRVAASVLGTLRL